MPRPKDYTDGSRRFRIVKSILCNAAVPYKAFSYFDDGTEYMRRILRKMLKEGELENHKSTRGIRFLTLPSETRIPKEIVQKMPEELVDYYLNVMQPFRLKSFVKDKTVNDQERVLTNADAAVFFEALCGAAYIFERPFLLDEEGSLPVQGGCYYGSREIKDVQAGYKDIVGKSQKPEQGGPKNIIGSRMNGVYITGLGKYFPVYDLGKHSITWSKTGETNMKRHVDKVMTMKGLAKNSIEGAVFLYSGDKVLNRVFNQKINPKREKNPVTLDLTYDKTFFIPQSKIGVQMMRIMSLPDWRNRVLRTVLTDDEIKHGGIETDGYDIEKRIYYDVFMIPDLTALKMFYRRAEMAKEGMSFEIFCFDFQEAEVREIFEKLPHVGINPVGFGEFLDSFLEET